MIRWRSYDLKHAAKISAESGEVFHPAVLDFSFLLFLVLSASCDLRWCICASAGPTGILVYFMAPCLQWISLHLSSRGWQDFLCVCVSADYCKCGIWQESKKVSIYWKKEYICIYCNIDSIQWCRCMTWHVWQSLKWNDYTNQSSSFASELYPPHPHSSSSFSASILDFSRHICSSISSSFSRFYLSIPYTFFPSSLPHPLTPKSLPPFLRIFMLPVECLCVCYHAMHSVVCAPRQPVPPHGSLFYN